MSGFLDHLGRDTLPEPMVTAFVSWCVLEQARPALAAVFAKATMSEISRQLEGATGFERLHQISNKAQQVAKDKRSGTAPMAISAAEAAAFEFNNMMQAATDAEGVDAEAVAFFAARVQGWATWADNDFANPQSKVAAEEDARDIQEHRLQSLWKQHGSSTN